MIKELRVENWKSFDQATLYIDPLTIVMGTNASGKSNLVEALLFLQRIGSGVDVDEAIRGNDVLLSLRGEAEWICCKPSDCFSLEALVEVPEGEDLRYRVNVWVDRIGVLAFDEQLTRIDNAPIGAIPNEEPVFKTKQVSYPPSQGGPPTESGIRHSVLGEVVHRYAVGMQQQEISYQTAAGDQKNIMSHGYSSSFLRIAHGMGLAKDDLKAVQYVVEHLERIAIFDPIPSHMRDYAPLSERLKSDGSNIAGVLAALDPQHRTKVEQILTRYLKALPERDIKRVWTEPVGKFGTDAMLYCEEGWEGAASHEIDARAMSDGTLRYLAIVAAMLLRPPGSLLVIEEVDNGLHPSRAHLLIEMLRTLGAERQIDVIVTTHNPALLDAAGVRMMPFIIVAHRDASTGASRLTQLEDIDQLPKLMAGGSLGQLAAAGRIESAIAHDGG